MGDLNNEITFFGETNFRNERKRFGIKNPDRRKHFYVIGKTGMGKTTLLENMAIQDIQRGYGVGIVDPHGEFAEKMLDFVPSNRINDVIYFNPADQDFPIAFNVIEQVDPHHRHLIASGMVGVFKKLWAESWGPRLEYVLRNAILALLEYPGSTILGIMRILVDKEYRKKVVERIQDPVVRSFWVDEFAKYPDRFMAEAVAPIQNKVGQFLTSPIIRNIVGQTKSTVNIRDIMDGKKILIMNLSKGLIGEDTSALLGAMLITKIQLAAMSRVDTPEAERNDFYLYVDEFQNFATDSFANILSEARKYRLNLLLAHQYIEQMSELVRYAVFGNVGTLLSFRVGANDAEYLEKEFAPDFTIDDLVNLGFGQVYLKLMIDGVASKPFSAGTLPPIKTDMVSSKEKIIKVSRERYGSDRVAVEEKIAKWSQVIEPEGLKKKGLVGQVMRPPSESMAERPAKKTMNSAICSNCAKETEVSFVPDGKRPVYCRECLEKKKNGELTVKKPPTPKLKSEVRVIESAEEPISLSKALGKEPKVFASAKKRKEVDISSLREALSEAMHDVSADADKDKSDALPVAKKSVAEEKNQNGEENKNGDLNPGEMISL